MTRREVFVCWMTAALALFAGCGGGSAAKRPYVSGGFHFDPLRGITLAISPVPMTGELGDRIDGGLTQMFADDPSAQLIARPAVVRQRMSVDHVLVVMLDRIQAQQFQPGSGQNPPSLRDILSEKELLDLHESLYATDLLLVPGVFVLRPSGASTRGSVLYRVYDLRTGSLILQDTASAEVPASGIAGERQAVTELIILVQHSFARHLLRQP